MIRIAKENDLENIRQLRKDVYSNELNQYPKDLVNLPGKEDGYYLIYIENENICGFIYISFSEPYEFNRHVQCKISKKGYEIGRLTVKKDKRYMGIAKSLYVASIKFCKSRNWSDIFYSFANVNFSDKYEEFGLKKIEYEDPFTKNPTHITKKCGDVNYVLMYCDLRIVNDNINCDCQIDLSIPANHGGNLLDNIKNIPTNIENNIVIADVLDAWYDPCVDIKELSSSFLIKTSPCTNSNQLLQTIRNKRNIPIEMDIICGAGSSDLIYRALPNWLNTKSNVLILKPTYSEYPHIFKNVIGCNLYEHNVGYDKPDLDNFKSVIKNGKYDMVCIVNPNSPTGHWIDLYEIIKENKNVEFWIDETYTDLVGIENKLEHKYLDNLYVLKSMSKSYALSGIRVAYLTGPKNYKMDRLKLLTPPWNVSYLGQVLAINALEDVNNYYPKMWEYTRKLREEMCLELSKTRKIIGGAGNFIVFSHNNPDKLRDKLRENSIYVRSFENAIRIAVRSKKENDLMIYHLNNFINL